LPGYWPGNQVLPNSRILVHQSNPRSSHDHVTAEQNGRRNAILRPPRCASYTNGR
jgi:hypothetical protein